jgi:hypothetical protein
MTQTLPIDALQKLGGACIPQCTLLRKLFPSGVISFETSGYARLVQAGVSVGWAVCLLRKDVLTALVQTWYDRALGNITTPWRDALRASLGKTTVQQAEQQVKDQLAARKAAASDPVALNVAGVGYAYAMLVARLAEPEVTPQRILSASVAFAQWCIRCETVRGNLVEDDVKAQYQQEIWAQLVQSGAHLPTGLAR